MNVLVAYASRHVYSHHPSWTQLARPAWGAWRTKFRGEPFIFASRHVMPDWSVLDRLGEITVPTLVMAGRSDFVFPPDCQAALAGGIPNARLRLVDRAGHNPHVEQTAETLAVISDFLMHQPSTAGAFGHPPSRPADDGRALGVP